MNKITEKMETGKHIFCAIDLHQKKMLAGIAVDRGPIRFYELDTDDAGGVAELLRLWDDLRERHSGSEAWFSYEASGSGFRLADVAREAGYRVSVLAPTNLPMTPKSRTNKTDKRDTVRVMDVVRGHVLAGADLPSAWIPPVELRDDREVVRHRLCLSDKLTEVKNQVHGLLLRNGVKKPASLKVNWTHKHLRWLWSLDGALGQGAYFTLTSYLRELEFYLGEIASVDAAMVELSQSDRYRGPVAALTEISGVAVLTAMVFLTELGDLSRFPNRRALGAYLGLTPRARESGEDETVSSLGEKLMFFQPVLKCGPSRRGKIKWAVGFCLRVRIAGCSDASNVVSIGSGLPQPHRPC